MRTSTRGRLLAAALIASLMLPPTAAMGGTDGTGREGIGGADAEVRAAIAAGGVQVSDREVVFAGADDVVGSSDDVRMVADAAYDDCPHGWVCLWNEKDFAGRMWQFQEVTSHWQRLVNWDANNKASSWRNRRNHDTRIAKDTSGGRVMRCLESHSQSSGFGSVMNNQADEIYNSLRDDIC
jgi:hypothetical protein